MQKRECHTLAFPLFRLNIQFDLLSNIPSVVDVTRAVWVDAFKAATICSEDNNTGSSPEASTLSGEASSVQAFAVPVGQVDDIGIQLLTFSTFATLYGFEDGGLYENSVFALSFRVFGASLNALVMPTRATAITNPQAGSNLDMFVIPLIFKRLKM